MDKSDDHILKLVRDIFPRIPYGLLVEWNGFRGKVINVGILPRYGYDCDNITSYLCWVDFFSDNDCIDIEQFKPVLRPLDDMFPGEKIEYEQYKSDIINSSCSIDAFKRLKVFLDSHMLDYNGLIDDDLAIPAEKDTYPFIYQYENKNQ